MKKRNYKGFIIKNYDDNYYRVCDGAWTLCKETRCWTLKRAKQRIDEEVEESVESYGQDAYFEQMHY